MSVLLHPSPFVPLHTKQELCQTRPTAMISSILYTVFAQAVHFGAVLLLTVTLFVGVYFAAGAEGILGGADCCLERAAGTSGAGAMEGAGGATGAGGAAGGAGGAGGAAGGAGGAGGATGGGDFGVEAESPDFDDKLISPKSVFNELPYPNPFVRNSLL